MFWWQMEELNERSYGLRKHNLEIDENDEIVEMTWNYYETLIQFHRYLRSRNYRIFR